MRTHIPQMPVTFVGVNETLLHRLDSVQHYTRSLNDILSALRPKLLARRKTYLAEEAEIFAAFIGEGQKAGEFAAGKPLETAMVLLLATNSLLRSA